jgi:hypothetical protein
MGRELLIRDVIATARWASDVSGRWFERHPRPRLWLSILRLGALRAPLLHQSFVVSATPVQVSQLVLECRSGSMSIQSQRLERCLTQIAIENGVYALENVRADVKEVALVFNRYQRPLCTVVH